MNRTIWAMSVALALATPAGAQQAEPELAPLVLPKAPAPKKNQKKRKAAPGAKQAPAPPAAAAPPELPLPPLVPLPAPPMTVGVLVQNDGLPASTIARVKEGLRGVVEIAPLMRSGPALDPEALQCADDACFGAAAAAQKIDRLLLATVANGALRLRLLDVAQQRQLEEAHQEAVSADDAPAVAEALACKLLVPAGCTGEVALDAGPGIQLELDGAPLLGGERQKVPVGVHRLAAKAGAQRTERALAVSREGAPALHGRAIDGRPVLLTAEELRDQELKPRPAPAQAVAAAPAAPHGRSWTRPAGIAALALGGAALATGAILGAKSRSDLDKAESAFHSNGGAYRAADLDSLSSGNSAAHGANALFVASAVLLAAGATLTLAF